MSDPYYLPSELDAPQKVILWTLDEVAVFIGPFLSCLIFFDAAATGILLGVAAVFCLKRLKRGRGINYLWQLAYWYLPPMIRFRAMPLSHLRFWIG